jgi:hypothetical protein
MAIWVNKAGSWTNVPQQTERIYVNSSGSWAEVDEVYGAEPDPFNIGSFLWKRIWKAVAPAPAGVDVSLIQPNFSGGPVEASWINASGVDGMQFDVRWYIDDLVYTTTSGNVNSSNSPQSISLAESNFSNGDRVRAEMRYVSGGTPGSYGLLSVELTYFI